MPNDLHSLIQSIRVVDVHEHHMPSLTPDQPPGLLQLMEESYAGWTQARPYPLPSEPPVTVGSPSSKAGSWKDVAAFVEGSGSNASVRNMIRSLSELYDIPGGEITASNWERLDNQVRRRNADPAWSASVMDKAGIETAISDPYRDPLMDVRNLLGDRYRSVFRINSLAVGWHPDSRDHNGNNGRETLSRLGRKPASFDEYLEALPAVLDALPGLNKVGLKNALAYDRSVDFDTLDLDAARAAWGQRDPTEHQRKAFGDCVVDRLCRLAGERDIPFQMHLGSALIRGSRPLQAAGLIERNPRTRFLLMHLAYPWSAELLGMAFVYRNIWIDLTWSWILSPTRFTSAFAEAIEVLTDDSRMMIGGDTWHAEEAYGAISGARRLIGEVLESKVASGYFGRRDAERLARKVLRENASAFFRLC
ncbi:MAG: amidohydrolase family protein [Spirochaetia bacterium]|jgi:hypothetical protein